MAKMKNQGQYIDSTIRHIKQARQYAGRLFLEQDNPELRKIIFPIYKALESIGDMKELENYGDYAKWKRKKYNAN